MSKSHHSRRQFLLSAFTVAATGGALATLAAPASAGQLVCLKRHGWRCVKWGKPPLPPKPDPKDIKRK